MEFPAAPVWDIHLSAPANILFLHHRLAKDVRKTVELAVGAGYHYGYHHYDMIGTKYLELLASSQHPLIEYHKIAVNKFDGVAYPTSVIDHVVMDIIGLLNWVSSTIGTNNWNHCKIEQEFKKVLAIWKEKDYTWTSVSFT